MVIYYGKRYNSASIGRRLVDVTCERCGCRYAYELARFGTGAASAPYAIGTAGAARSAAEQSKKELDRRLEREAEMVPCPTCLWVNEDLIRGYRLSRHRGWGRTAAFIGLGGTLPCLAIAWLMSIGPAAGQPALPRILFGGPAISLGLAGVILLTRHLLRLAIRPNRDHPFPTAPPPGTPSALIRDPASGRLEASASDLPADGIGGPWVDFQVGRSGLPERCCECLAPSASASAYRRPIVPAVEVHVPLCPPCAGRWRRRRGVAAAFMFALLVGSAFLLSTVRGGDPVALGIGIGAVALSLPIVGSMVGGRRAAPVRVKVVDAARGVVRLRFRNEKFASLPVGGRRD